MPPAVSYYNAVLAGFCDNNMTSDIWTVSHRLKQYQDFKAVYLLQEQKVATSEDQCIRPAANCRRYHVRIKCNCSRSSWSGGPKPTNAKIVFAAISISLPSFRFFPSPTAPSLHVRLFYCSQNPRRATDSRTSALIIRRNLRIESLARLVRSKFVAVASRKEEFSTTVGFRYHVTLFNEVLHPPSL